MKKLFVLLVVLAAMVGLAFAQPFLVSNPQTDATKYRMRLSTDAGATWGTWVEGPAVNNALRFDLANIPPASYQGQAQAGAVYTVTDSTTGQTTTADTWSTSAPFVLNVQSSSPPAAVRVQN